MGGVSTGGGGLSSSSAASSGDAGGQSGSGNKQFNFGANPNLASNAVLSTFTNPIFLVALVGVIWLARKK